MLSEHHVLNDLPFYKVTRAVDAKARQDRLDQRENKRQEGMLWQAWSENCPTTSFTVCLSAKKKKPVAQPTKKVLTLALSSSLALASVCSSAASIEQDSATDLSFTGTKQEMEVEPMVPRIICKAKKEEEMTTDVRVGFKERQRKRLFESITFTPPPTKKSCPKVPRLTPISDIPSVLNPSTDVEGPNCVSTARPPVGKYAHTERGGASTGPIPPSDDPIECVASNRVLLDSTSMQPDDCQKSRFVHPW